MDMIHPICETFFGVAPIEGDPLRVGGHDHKTMPLHQPGHRVQIGMRPDFHQHIHNILCPYPFNRRASDVADPVKGKIREQRPQQTVNRFEVLSPLVGVLNKKNREQRPQFFQSHVGQCVFLQI